MTRERERINNCWQYTYEIDCSSKSIQFTIDENNTAYVKDLTTYGEEEMLAESGTLDEAKAKCVGYANGIEVMVLYINNLFIG